MHACSFPPRNIVHTLLLSPSVGPCSSLIDPRDHAPSVAVHSHAHYCHTTFRPTGGSDDSLAQRRATRSHMAFFPSPGDPLNTKFQVTSDVGTLITHLIVEGSTLSHESATPTLSRISSFTTPGTSGLCMQPERPICPQWKTQSVNVKVVQAELRRLPNGRPEFTPLNQTFVDITDVTANVEYTTLVIQRKWSICLSLQRGSRSMMAQEHKVCGLCTCLPAVHVYNS